jgi:iron-sulfur cluster repair protein YtfE (RIC family)
MAQSHLYTTLGMIALMRPAAVHTFRAYGFDLDLEHDRPLEEAAAMRGIDPQLVLAELTAAEQAELPSGQYGWDWEEALHEGVLPPAGEALVLPDAGEALAA